MGNQHLQGVFGQMSDTLDKVICHSSRHDAPYLYETQRVRNVVSRKMAQRYQYDPAKTVISPHRFRSAICIRSCLFKEGIRGVRTAKCIAMHMQFLHCRSDWENNVLVQPGPTIPIRYFISGRDVFSLFWANRNENNNLSSIKASSSLGRRRKQGNQPKNREKKIRVDHVLQEKDEFCKGGLLAK